MYVKIRDIFQISPAEYLQFVKQDELGAVVIIRNMDLYEDDGKFIKSIKVNSKSLKWLEGVKIKLPNTLV